MLNFQSHNILADQNLKTILKTMKVSQKVKGLFKESTFILNIQKQN